MVHELVIPALLAIRPECERGVAKPLVLGVAFSNLLQRQLAGVFPVKVQLIEINLVELALRGVEYACYQQSALARVFRVGIAVVHHAHHGIG